MLKLKNVMAAVALLLLAACSSNKSQVTQVQKKHVDNTSFIN